MNNVGVKGIVQIEKDSSVTRILEDYYFQDSSSSERNLAIIVNVLVTF